MPKKKPEPKNFDPGKVIFAWEAHDYHPHRRGWVWMGIFCLIIFGGAGWALWTGDWVMAFTFFAVAAIYFFFHRKGHESHQIGILEKGLQVDTQFFPWDDFSGFWFVYDEMQAVSIVNFQKAEKDQKLSLQMGMLKPDDLRDVLKKVELEELKDKKESLVDLWIRALKL